MPRLLNRARFPAQPIARPNLATVRSERKLKPMKTADAAISDFEVMLALRRSSAVPFQYGPCIMGKMRLIARQFGIYTAWTLPAQSLISVTSSLATKPISLLR